MTDQDDVARDLVQRAHAEEIRPDFDVEAGVNDVLARAEILQVTGVKTGRVDPEMLAATDNFATAVAAAVETGAELIEPSHILIALARIPDGLTRSLFAADGIPVDVFVDALRIATKPARDTLITAFTEDTISAATHKTLKDLAVRAPGRTLCEHDILAVLLPHLEPPARDLLAIYGGADLARWLREGPTITPEPARLFGADGRLAVDAFTPAARTVLANLVTEASTLGYRELSTLLLLHAMATFPQGLIEQAALFLRFDLHRLRAQFLVLLRRGHTPRHVVETTLDTDAVGASLRMALERAAASAAWRGAGLIAERDLLVGLLDSPAGAAVAELRTAGIDVAGLRRFADHLYTELAAVRPTSETVTMSFQELVDWFRANLICPDDVVDRLLPRVELIKLAAQRGLRMGERPLGTFLFCGPTGTGKTVTAGFLAKVIYGSTDNLIVFEMGQFNSRKSINKFIGAPPGYIGFGEGQLTDRLRRNPRSVLLFDEVEKAHPLVLDALLRLLDEGRVNDPAGSVRDARDAVVVFTSNLGAKEFAGLSRIRKRELGGAVVLGADRVDQQLHNLLGISTAGGAAEPDEPTIATDLRHVLGSFFRPEFLDRFDETILFAPWGARELEAIASAGLRRRAEQLSASFDVKLSWDAEVPGHLVRDATRRRADEAARGLNRCVDEVLQLLLRALDDTEGRVERPKAIRVVVRQGQLTVARHDG